MGRGEWVGGGGGGGEGEAGEAARILVDPVQSCKSYWVGKVDGNNTLF